MTTDRPGNDPVTTEAPEPGHRLFLVVDIESFGTRSDPDQKWLRQRMYAALRTALSAAGIDWEQCDREDRGDGVLFVIPAEVSKVTVTDTFLVQLRAGLRQHARQSGPTTQMRMRVALHAGEVSRDAHGWTGTDLNTACRLVDAQPLRQALAANEYAELAVIVSDSWFNAVVRHEYGLIDRTSYEAVPVNIKELHGQAWIHVPLGGGAHPGGGSHAVVAPASPEPGRSQASSGAIIFNGSVEMQDLVNGPKTQIHHHGGTA